MKVESRIAGLIASGWYPGKTMAGFTWADFNEFMDWLDHVAIMRQTLDALLEAGGYDRDLI